MATYNWAYRPGIANKYGFVIAASADDVKPSNAAYFALFGNDITGNGSRTKPWKTPQINNRDYAILASGVYRTRVSGLNGVTCIGDGDVTFDTTYFFGTNLFEGNTHLYNIKIKGTPNALLGNFNDLNLVNCVFDGVFFHETNTINLMENCVVKNVRTLIPISSRTNKRYINNTFVNCNHIRLGQSVTQLSNTVFYNCNIVVPSTNQRFKNIIYSLFYRCNFSNTITGGASDYLLYPSVSVGFVFKDTAADLFNYLGYDSINIFFGDPKFNNPEIGDYSLAFDSPAKNLSYFGTYVGAQSIGYAIKAKTVESAGDFDFDTAVNISVVDNSIKITGGATLASIDTKVKTNLIGRELGRAPIYGFYADRNGEYIDSIADLSSTAVNAGTDLQANTPYIVRDAAITYNGAVIQAGERFTTTVVLTFTTSFGGYVNEIIEAPQRHTIMARFSNGSAVGVDDLLVGDDWYYVAGTITHDGVTYNDEVFKATDVMGYTGTGTVTLAMGNSEPYQHYEYGIKFTSNNVGNVRTGEIVRGNGDPDYVRTVGSEFPINARFIQLRYILRGNNLRP